MKFSLSLLKMFLNTNAPLEQIAGVATAIGLEVDGIEDKSAALKPFVVAEILETERHPQADKLQVCKVKTLSGTLQIVCGAPNARAGIKVALANIGTIIPTNNMEIKKAAVRGVESQGMLCSARELGLGDDHAGIIELPLDAKIGDSIVDVLGLADPVFDLNITANRGDCMGVYGIARDLAAAGLGTLTQHPLPTIHESGAPFSVTIRDHGCKLFIGRVIRDVKNGMSPEWMQRALTAAGMRPISALVDITNYFTLAYGRPLHVYDMAKLEGSIIVRSAEQNESFAALNDKTYTLNVSDCVIVDEKKLLGLGGIMGGSESAVSEATTDILLETAVFDPIRIAKSGRRLQIDSDARTRFERGVDHDFAKLADCMATNMIIEQCGGIASAPTIADGSFLSATAPALIPFNVEAINALGGTNIPREKMEKIITALGFEIVRDQVKIPSWRHDVSQAADLAEEVLRIVGYDAIPLAPLPKPTYISKPAIDSNQNRTSLVKRALVTRGMHETYSWGFCSEAQAAAFGGQSEALHLLNPISAELSVMRPNILPHLLDALKANTARGLTDIAMFELGATFVDVTPIGQRSVAAGIRVGLKHGTHWAGSPKTDVFDVKADALTALETAGLDTSKIQTTRNVPAWYHPGRSGAFQLGPKNTLATFGELHPATLKVLGIDFPVLAFEVHLDNIPASKTAKRKAFATSDFQAVTRDFAFVVDSTLASSELVKVVQAAEKKLLRDVTIFDVYVGKGVEDGKKSIALSITLQADDRTLTDSEIETVSKAIITSAMKVGAALR